jgi:hypothetical protein
MRKTRWAARGLLLGLVLLAGCQRLNLEKTVNLPPGASDGVEVSPPKYDQTVVVTATGGDVPLSLYLFLLEDDPNALQKITDRGKPNKDVLSSKEKELNPTLESKVPSGKSFAVLVSNAGSKTTEVTLKIKGR